MRRALRLALACLALLAFYRAALFLAYAAVQFGNPIQVYHLEAQMVHLAWRAQQGRALYPDWRDGPHVINVFGPLYFLAVGRLGRRLGADLDELARIGRLVTVGSGLAAALLVGLAAGRREGRSAGGVAALMALGATPMIGFGAMVRADVAADLLGFAGFLLAAGRPARGRGVLGAALLVAAIYTKQTAGLYLVAAVAAAWLSGRRRRAVGLALGAGAAMLAIAAAATLAIEPHFARDFFRAAATPASPDAWLGTMTRLLLLGVELPALAVAGIALWTSRRPRDVPLATLAAVLLVGSIATPIKSGSDLNYFLGLRLAAALAAGAAWGAASRLIRDPSPGPDGRGRRAAALIGLVALTAALVPSAIHVEAQLQFNRELRRSYETDGRPVLREFRRLLALADDPGIALLTDNGMIALHQRDRAAFVDPWLFRVMVATGRIRPEGIRRRLEEGGYDYVITTRDLFDEPSYAPYDFSLPPELAEAARRHYRPAGRSGSVFVFEPRAGRRTEGADPGG